MLWQTNTFAFIHSFIHSYEHSVIQPTHSIVNQHNPVSLCQLFQIFGRYSTAKLLEKATIQATRTRYDSDCMDISFGYNMSTNTRMVSWYILSASLSLHIDFINWGLFGNATHKYKYEQTEQIECQNVKNFHLSITLMCKWCPNLYLQVWSSKGRKTWWMRL